MADRPIPPGQPLESFLDSLPPERLRALLNHLGAGVFSARHAAQCVTGAGAARHETTLLLVTYLSTAIRELEAARAIVTEQIEGGEVAR